MKRVDGAVGSKPPVDKRVALIVASLASFLGSLMNSSLNIAIPSIGREFGVDAISLSWIATANLLAMAIFLVPVGRIGDIYGRRKVFLCGGVAWTIVSLLCGLAPSVTLLIAFRGLQGIAGTMFTATSMAILSSFSPPEERGRALGVSVAAVYVGLAVGPSAGGFMTQQLGWRSILLVSSALGLIIVALTHLRMRSDWADARGEKLDLVGSALFGIALLAIMYGFSVLPAIAGGWLILIGIVALTGFVYWETRVPNPVLNIDLFRRNAVFAFSNAAALINYAATFAITFLLSLHLQYVKGLDPQTAGLILLAQPAMMAIFSPLAGRVSDRIEPRIVASTGMAVTTVGLILLAFLSDSSGVGYVVLALLTAGFGFALFSSPNSNAIMGSVERRYLGIASASVALMRAAGQMLSMGIATVIIAIYVGGVQITPQNHAAFSSGFRLAFTIFAALCFLGVFFSLARGKLHTKAAVEGGPRMPTAPRR